MFSLLPAEPSSSEPPAPGFVNTDQEFIPFNDCWADNSLYCNWTGDLPPYCFPFCELLPTALDFGTVQVGTSREESFTISNVGTGSLSGSVTGSCTHYSIVSGEGSYDLSGGQTRTVTVRFEPTEPGTHECTIGTGSVSCGDVSCTGIAEAAPECDVTPASIDFGTIHVLETKDTTFTITNSGESILNGSVSEACASFSVITGTGNFSLYTGESRLVTVRYQPTESGTHTCVIETGTYLCGDVTITGSAIGPICDVEPQSIAFPGPIQVGSTQDATFTITNEGWGVLTGTVNLSCDHFSIVSNGGPFSLTHGQSRVVTVRFEPTDNGTHECTVALGQSLCGDVSLVGEAWMCPPGSVLYVNANATGSGDGSSWEDAFTELRDALAYFYRCPNMTQIWVAEGTYTPTAGTDRSVSFMLYWGMALYGGFAGGETSLSERNPVAHTTILSGNIGAPEIATDNSYHVIKFIGSNHPSDPLVLDGFTVTGGYANSGTLADKRGGGLYISNLGPFTMRNVTVCNNFSSEDGGGAYCLGRLTMDNVVLSDNSSGHFGGGMYFNNEGTLSWTNVQCLNNTAVANGGGLCLYYTYRIALTNALFYGNRASNTGGGLYYYGTLNYTPRLTNTTFSKNVASAGGGGIWLADYAKLAVANSVLWDDSSGTGNYSEIKVSAGATTISYSTVKGCGGSGAGWDPTFGTDGGNNLDLNPSFYDGSGGDLRLLEGSPAIDAGNNSPTGGLPATDLAGNPRIQNGTVDMGAYEGGAIRVFSYAQIDSVVDVPGDQGGWVRVYFTRSLYDDADESQYPLARYDVHRRVDNPALIADMLADGEVLLEDSDVMLAGGEKVHLVAHASDTGGRYLFYADRYFIVNDGPAASAPPGIWEVVGNVSAAQQSHYIRLAPTLSDFSATEPWTWSVFYISAHTTTPSVFFASPPDSGYSVDNLPPGVPQHFEVAYNTGTGNHLEWDPCSDPDFQYFKIYRGTNADFIPALENKVHETAATQWIDPECDGPGVYYKVAAVDHAGNESDPASPEITTDADGDEAPKMYALYQNVPNPFNPETTIRYDVPANGGEVTLVIFDVNGSVVRTLVEGPQTAGAKYAVWDGRDNWGRTVASGVYFYRFTAPGYSKAHKMVLMK